MGTTNKVAQGLIDMAKRIESLETALAAMTAERDESGRRLGEFQLRLAGALIASEGGNGCPDGAIECIRTCPTIASVMRLRAERDALRDVAAKFEREYENGFPAHATGSIGGTGHPIGSCADCGACRLHAVYEKARALARAAVEGEKK